MSDTQPIRTAIERVAQAVSLRPSVGQGTAVTRARLGDALSVQIEDGQWKFAVGMSEKYGGTNDAPNPGVYGRAALASCLAIGYGIWASRLNVPIESLEVEVQADYDVRGELAVDPSIPPGYLAVRYIVTVESPATEQEINHLLDTADRHSSWRDDYERQLPLTREVRISAPRKA